MAEFTIRVIKGRERWDIPVRPQTTFAELRKEVETRADAIEGGIRLLYRGKGIADDATLESANVTAGTRLMALSTEKQHKADDRTEKRSKAAQDSAALNAMRERRVSTAGSEGSSPNQQRSLRGDPEVSGQSNVILVKGRDKFRVNVDLSASVGDLKVIASRLDGIDASPRDMKMLFKGRFMSDAVVLSDSGIHSGSSIMLMFGARYHDGLDAKADLTEIEEECSLLEDKVRQAVAKARGRLLDTVDLALAKGEVLDMFKSLKNRIESVKGHEEQRKSLLERVAAVEPSIDELDRFG